MVSGRKASKPVHRAAASALGITEILEYVLDLALEYYESARAFRLVNKLWLAITDPAIVRTETSTMWFTLSTPGFIDAAQTSKQNYHIGAMLRRNPSLCRHVQNLVITQSV